MRHEDESLHYYVDGVDQGVACDGVPPHVYAVVDLYGQCAQVSIVQLDRGRENTAPVAGAVIENSSQPISLQHLQQANTHSHPNSETTHRYTLCLLLVKMCLGVINHISIG
jgi:neuralized-like protein 4